jgi:hypothetical protein
MDRSTRVVRWWVRRYTAGLAPSDAWDRRAEIDSDLAEHCHARRGDGWAHRHIVRERVTRLVRGMRADLAWRQDLLHRNTNRLANTATGAVTAVASLLIAGYHFVFAAYLLGTTTLGERRFLGGLGAYAEEVDRPVAGAVAATIIATLGVVLIAATVARPAAPMTANVATMSVASLSLTFFWLGVWPVALVAIAGALTDLARRGATPPPLR